MNSRVTDGVAGAALMTPLWLPSLQQVSEISATLLPIAGLLWLCVQIVGYVIKNRKK